MADVRWRVRGVTLWLLAFGIIVGSGACSRTWTTVDVHELRGGRQREPLFVVTTGEAHLLEDARIASDSVSGTPVKSWEFPFDPELTVHSGDRPDSIAKRLGWRASPVGDHVEIKLSIVRYVSINEKSAAPARIIGATLVGLLTLGFVGLVVLFFSSPVGS